MGMRIREVNPQPLTYLDVEGWFAVEHGAEIVAIVRTRELADWITASKVGQRRFYPIEVIDDE